MLPGGRKAANGTMSGCPLSRRFGGRQEGWAGEGVVNHHDVEHARDHRVHPAQLHALVPFVEDGVQGFVARRALEVAEEALRLVLVIRDSLAIAYLAILVVLPDSRPGGNANPKLADE